MSSNSTWWFCYRSIQFFECDVVLKTLACEQTECHFSEVQEFPNKEHERINSSAILEYHWNQFLISSVLLLLGNLFVSDSLAEYYLVWRPLNSWTSWKPLQEQHVKIDRSLWILKLRPVVVGMNIRY